MSKVSSYSIERLVGKSTLPTVGLSQALVQHYLSEGAGSPVATWHK